MSNEPGTVWNPLDRHEDDRKQLYTGEDACPGCGGTGANRGLVRKQVYDCPTCAGTGHRNPAAEMARLRTALEEIKREQGRVCPEFELCRHVACQSSYSSWAIADKALAAAEQET